ncbi:MAG TPA: GNAT family N-acetyltransferase [Microthrixaceae bacterium]|nr:GNAT family N-acetyltransferase [Microthrixaceae bacterium]
MPERGPTDLRSLELRSPRLRLRRWTSADSEPFASMNADPVVMEYFPATLAKGQSDALMARFDSTFESTGIGMFAVEVLETGEFAGAVGLMQVGFDAPFAPAVEVAWRLAARHWGRGFATEAAAAAMADGFDRLGLAEIVSFTVPANKRSIRVMERLGMSHDETCDFDHPSLPLGDPLRRHVLFRATGIRLQSAT